jgi:hypothetical protein
MILLPLVDKIADQLPTSPRRNSSQLLLLSSPNAPVNQLQAKAKSRIALVIFAASHQVK